MGKKVNDSSKLRISYDRSADVLYASLGPSRPGIAMEIDDGDFVRVDPYTDEVVGVTVLDFHERFSVLGNNNIEDSAPLIVSNILKEFQESQKAA